MDPHIVSTVGLVLDIAGALWMVKGFIAMSDEAIAAASDRSAVWAGGPETYNPRPALQRLLQDSRRDARAGGVLLAVGFGLQLVAVWLR